MSNSCKPMDCSLPCSSVHGIFQARILEWVAIFSRSIPGSGRYPGEGLGYLLQYSWASLVGKIPWRREWKPAPVFLPGERGAWQSIRSHRVRHDWVINLSTATFQLKTRKIYSKLHLKQTRKERPELKFMKYIKTIGKKALKPKADSLERLTELTNFGLD